MAKNDGSLRGIQQALSKAMIKPLKITANLGEMLVKGTIKDYASVNLPAVTGVFETNADFARSMVKAVQDPKDAVSRAFKTARESETVKAAEQLVRYAIDDLKSGELYSNQRDREGAFSLMDEFGDFDFSDFDENGDWSESANDESDNVAFEIADKQEENADRRTEALLTGIGVAAEATTKTSIALHKDDIRSAVKRHSQTITSLTNITTLLAGTYETMNNHLTAMTEMAREMNNGLTSEITSIKQILTEIRDHQIPKKEPSRFAESTSPFDPYSGAFDIKKYGKQILRNISDNTMLGMLGSMIDPETVLQAMSDNPLQIVMDQLFNAIVPKSTKEALTKFDRSVRGFFPSVLTKLYNYAEDPTKEGILPILASIFGYKERSSSYIDPSAYNKDKVDFTGKVQKAITEVMPSQLSRIISILTGEPMKIFNYDSGKFVDTEKTYMEYTRKSKDLVGSMYETTAAFDKRVNNDDFKITQQEKKDLNDYWYRFIQNAAEDNILINPNLSDADFNLLLPDVKDAKSGNMKDVVRAIVKSMTEDEILGINSEIVSARQDRDTRRQRIAQDLDSSGLYAAFNGIDIDSGRGRRLGDLAISTRRAPSSMDTDDYKELMKGYTDKFKRKSMLDIVDNILNILKRGVIVYSYNAGTAMGDNAAFQDAVKDQGKFTDRIKERLEAEKRKKENEEAEEELRKRNARGKYETIYRSNGKGMAVDMDSTVDDLIRAFTGLDGEEERVYENEEDQKAYERKKHKSDKINNAITEKLGFIGRVQDMARKPFDILETALDSMNKSMFRIVYGKDAEDMLKGDDGEDGSIMSAVTKTMKANLNKFGTWFNEEVVKRLIKDDDAPLKKLEGKAKEWVGDNVGSKVKNKYERAKTSLVGVKDENTGKYSGGRFSEKANFAQDVMNDAKGQIKNQMTGYMDIFKDSLNTVLYGEEWHQQKIIDKDGNVTYGNIYKTKGKGGVVGMFRDASNNLKDFLFGTDENSESRKIWKDVKEETKKALPGAAAGTVIGGVGTMATGLITGMWLPGGPIFGAMLGSAAGFIGASDKLKDHIFGPQIDPDDPSQGRKGGLIDRDVQQAFKKYFPSVAIGAGIGATAANFGILPSFIGPAAGAVIGSFGGMAYANKELREVIFGNAEDDDSGYISKNTRKKMIKKLPGAILGGASVNAIVGSMNGMGLIPSLLTTPAGPIATMIGAIAGTFAAPKLEKFFFGEKDKNGNYIPGKEGVFAKVFNFTKTKLFDPFFKRVNEMGHSIGKWFKDSILSPLSGAMEPIKRELREGGGLIKKAFMGLGNILKGAVDSVFERAFGKPLGEIADTIAKKTGQLVNFVATSIGKAIGSTIAAPFKFIGFMGNRLKKRQEKRKEKRFKDWKKTHKNGTWADFEEFDANDTSNAMDHVIDNAIEKAEKQNAPGTKNNPIIDVIDEREKRKEEAEAKGKAAADTFNINYKDQKKKNDVANPPNTAETRTATAVENIEKIVGEVVEEIRGQRKDQKDRTKNSKQSPFSESDIPKPGTSADTQQSRVDDIDPNNAPGRDIRGNIGGYQFFASKREETANTPTQSFVDAEYEPVGDNKPDKENGLSVTSNPKKWKTAWKKKRFDPMAKTKDENWIADGTVKGPNKGGVSGFVDKIVNSKDVRRDSILYRSLYKRFNERIKEAKNPQDAVDQIVMSAPVERQDMYRTVLRDIVALNDPNGMSRSDIPASKADAEAEEKYGGTSLFDLLGNNTALLGSIAGILMTLLGGGDGNMVGNVFKGIIGAKVLKTVVNTSKKISTAYKKIKSAIPKIKNAIPKVAGKVKDLNGVIPGGSFNVLGGYASSFIQLTDDNDLNDSFGVHNIANATHRMIEGMAKESGLEGVKGSVIGFNNPTANNIASKIINGAKSAIDKLINSRTIKSLAGSKFVNSLSKLRDYVVSYLTKHTPTLVTNALKKTGNATARMLSTFSPFAIMTAAFGVYDFISGMSQAHKYFEVSQVDTTMGMKLAAAFTKTAVGLLSAVPHIGFFLSFLPVKPLAQGLYKLIASKDDEAELENKQQSLQAEVDKYNAENGTDLSVEDYQKTDAYKESEKEKKDAEKDAKREERKQMMEDYWNLPGDAQRVQIGTARSAGGVKYKYVTKTEPPEEVGYEKKSTLFGKTTYTLNQSQMNKWKEYEKGATGTGRGKGISDTAYTQAIAKLGKGRTDSDGNVIYDQTDSKLNSKDPTMKDAGCGPTVAAMMAQRLGRGTDPVEASQMAYANGYRASDGGTNPKFFEAYGKAKGVDMHQGSTDTDSITSSLRNGNPVALMGQGGAFGSGMHYMLANKMGSGNTVELIDPIGGKQVKTSASSLTNKVSSAIYGSGRRRFGRGLKKIGTVKQYVPDNDEIAKSLAGNSLTANEVTEMSSKIGKVVPDNYGRGRFTNGRFGSGWGRGTANEQAVKILKIAEGEIGYLEKASNSQLEDKTANVGDKNYTKYGAWYGLNGPGAPWCAMFVVWCCAKAGVSTDIVPKNASCDGLANFARKHNRFYLKGKYTPKTGDIILYGTTSDLTHTGLVYAVEGNNVITIEGNTGSGERNRDGGCVRKKSVPLNNDWICGYFSPAYNGQTVEFSGSSSSSDSDSSESIEGSATTGLAAISEKLSGKMSKFTDAFSSVSKKLSKPLDLILGTNSGDDEDSTSSGSSDGSVTTSYDSGGTLSGGSEYPKYTDLTDKQKKFVAGVASAEQRSDDITAQRLEVSQMANLNDGEKGREANAANIIKTLNSGWYAKASLNKANAGKYSPQAMQAVEEVLVQGKRTLPRYVTEHDYYGDINNIDLNPATDTGKKNRKNLKVGDLITNSMGSKYYFYKFAGKNGPEGSGDPFGWKANLKDKFSSDVPWGSGRGLSHELTDRAKTINTELVTGRGKAEQANRVNELANNMEATVQAYGRGAADSEILNRMVSLFEQVVPILQKIELNTSKFTPATASGPAVTGKGSSSTSTRQSVPKAPNPVVKAFPSRDRLGTFYDVGSSAIDKITSR